MKVSELKRLTLDDLRKVTWNYLSEEIVGEFDDHLIINYLFDTKKCGKVHPFMIRKCNVAEGWVEFIECHNPPGPNSTLSMSEIFAKVEIKKDEDGNYMTTKIDCEVVVDILDRQGKVIVTLEREKDGS